MPTLQLKGGFYQARSYIANAQRCINLYPEKNPEDAEAPYTLYLTPGLLTVGAPSLAAPWRGLYTATNGTLYGVCGINVYAIDPNWTLTLLGVLSTVASTPVGMIDNGATLVIVDGTAFGYQVTLATGTFSTITDANFRGATLVDYLDTFLLFNEPATNRFYSSLSNGLVFDPTYFAAKTGFPDPIAGLIVMHRELWLFGSQRTTEIWYNAGSAAFPFAISQGVFIEHGCAAPYSICKHDLIVFWLSVDKDGAATVFQGSNYTAKKISTPAIASEFSKYAKISDAIGMTYKQQDHVFYVLTFPMADKTWVYDVTEDKWHERAWMDPNGRLHRHRANCMAFAYGKNVCGDFINGQLYVLDLNTYVDAGVPIFRRRSYEHTVNEGKRISYSAFRADMEAGADFVPQVGGPNFSFEFSDEFGPSGTLQLDNVYLRWSDDRGKSFGQPIGQTLGGTGGYIVQPQWRQLGMARDRVFDLFWALPQETALNGAWIDAIPAGT